MYPLIRQATSEDVDSILHIAHQYRDELGYVHPVALRSHIAAGTVLVCKVDGRLVGFVEYHARRDGWQTIYHLATDKSMTGQGIGRQLLYAVPCPIRLKVTQSNETATKFYESAGMRLAGTEAGKKRPLNVHELKVLGIFCMGNGKGDTFPTIARASGMAYGVRNSEQARAWPYMLDIDWKKYNDGKFTWLDYMSLVHEYHPVQAMCVDYESPEQRPQLERQIADLRAAGVLRVMVCPKFHGAVAHIPDGCIVAVSVPSEYAGFVPDGRELAGRHVHLLGGSPHAQRTWSTRLQAAGARIISFDGNAHERGASGGRTFSRGKWRAVGEGKISESDYRDICINSGRNWLSMMQSVIGVQQLRLI